MAVTYAVQIEVSPLQQYRQILGLLQLDDEHTFIDRVQNAGRHIDHVTRMHLDSVKHAEKSVDVLAHHQRLEVVAGYVLLQAKAYLSTFDDVPRPRLCRAPCRGAQLRTRRADARGPAGADRHPTA